MSSIFKAFIIFLVISGIPLNQRVVADWARYQDILEMYDICDYRKIIISKNKTDEYYIDALLPIDKNPGYTARAYTGQFIGLNYGEITAINSNGFSITEYHLNEKGGWNKIHKRFTVNNRVIVDCQLVNIPPKYDNSKIIY